MAKLDKLGRLVIPKEYREKLGIQLGDDVDMLLSDAEVTIKAKTVSCCICRKNLDADTTVPLCEKCIRTLVEKAQQNDINGFKK